jgi:AcrR family transcriptional regulator
MEEVAGTAGYSGASVARVSAAAGVSRVTFYRYFANREECFTACCRAAAARLERALSAVVEANPEAGPGSVLGSLLREVRENPVRARVVLLEAPGGPAAARARYERFVERVEDLLRSGSRVATPKTPSLWAPPAVLLGGAIEIATAHTLVTGGGNMRSLDDHLTAWVDSYAVEAGETAPEEEHWERLGRHFAVRSGSWSRSLSLPAPTSRRERLIEATAAVTARTGYAGMRVADIVAVARVQRRAFYSEFGDKREAFRAAQILHLERSIAVAAQQFSLGGSWPERIWRGLAGLYGYLVQHPEEAKLVLVEVFAAGEEEIRLGQNIRGAFSIFLEEGYRQRRAGALPTLCSQAIGGAIYSLLRRTLVCQSTSRLPELLPLSAFVALAPFLGPREALAFVEFKSHGSPRPRKTVSGLPAPAGRGETVLPAGRV